MSQLAEVLRKVPPAELETTIVPNKSPALMVREQLRLQGVRGPLKISVVEDTKEDYGSQLATYQLDEYITILPAKYYLDTNPLKIYLYKYRRLAKITATYEFFHLIPDQDLPTLVNSFPIREPLESEVSLNDLLSTNNYLGNYISKLLYTRICEDEDIEQKDLSDGYIRNVIRRAYLQYKSSIFNDIITSQLRR